MWRWAAILFLGSLLSGCYSDQEQQLGRCKADAQNRYPIATWDFGDRRQESVALCMEANGYRLTRFEKSCNIGENRLVDGSLYAVCYQPMSPISRALFHIEMMFY